MLEWNIGRFDVYYVWAYDILILRTADVEKYDRISRETALSPPVSEVLTAGAVLPGNLINCRSCVAASKSAAICTCILYSGYSFPFLWFPPLKTLVNGRLSQSGTDPAVLEDRYHVI